VIRTAALLLLAASACHDPHETTAPSASQPTLSASAPDSSEAPTASLKPKKQRDPDDGLTGIGEGAGRLPPDDPAHRPVLESVVRKGATDVSGRLPPEVINRIVRHNFGRFRLCYQAALSREPKLEAKLATTFVIDVSGAVRAATSTGDTSDKVLLSCVQHTFYGLSFPQPEGGTVKVTYRFELAPPPFAFTIEGKPSAAVEKAELLMALDAAGYKLVDVDDAPKSGNAPKSADARAVQRFKVAKAGVTLSLTFDPTGSLLGDAYAALKNRAVFLEDGNWFLAVEGDKALAQAMIDAIHKKLPLP